MNKKVVMLFILGIFLVSSISFVYAQEKTFDPVNVIKTAVNKVLEWANIDVKNNMDKAVALIKVLLFIALLTIYYQGLNFVFSKNEALKTNKAVPFISALAIAVISIIFIPKEVIQAIAVAWGGVSSALLLFIPLVVAGYFIIHVIPVGDDATKRFWYIVKALATLLIIVLIYYIADLLNLGLLKPGVL